MLASLKEIYKIGPGPSSSHTIGPYNAVKQFKEEIGDRVVTLYVVTLFGSLALTGRGHKTDEVIKKVLGERTIINFDINKEVAHPNTLIIQAFNNSDMVKEEVYNSIGGGTVKKLNAKRPKEIQVYPFKNFSHLRKAIEKKKFRTLLEFVKQYEDEDIEEYLTEIFQRMCEVVEIGLSKKGEVAGSLHVKRIAKDLYDEAINFSEYTDKRSLLISAYAYAVSECNADNEMIVTAPTCGSAGILPAVLYYYYKHLGAELPEIIEALIMAGLIAAVIKKNATISGAVGGCQAEVGSATSMAAGALCILNNLSLAHVEYAAEVGLEHQLGLTCDPVGGYVAIPCIERNAYSALKAYDSYLYAKHLKKYRDNAVTLDEVIQAMKETGNDLCRDYKETSLGGLAKTHKIHRV